jgi:hypothetical protein
MKKPPAVTLPPAPIKKPKVTQDASQLISNEVE